MITKIKFGYAFILMFTLTVMMNCSSAEDKKIYQSTKEIIKEVTTIREAQPDQAMNLAQRAYLISRHNNDIAGQAEVLKHRGYLFEKANNPVKAIEDYQNALSLYKNVNDIDNQCKCANNIGYNYYKRFMHDEASKWLSMSENFCREANDSVFLHLNYSNQGLNFLKIKKYESAQIYFKKSLELSQLLQSSKQIGEAYNNLSYAAGEAKDYASSSAYAQKTLEVALKNSVPVLAASAYNNLSYYNYFLQGKYEEAVPLYLKALDYAEDNDDKIDFLYNLGTTYANLGQLPQAEEYFNEAIANARRLNNHEDEINSVRALADAYRASSSVVHKQRANHMYKQLYELEDRYTREDMDAMLLSVTNTSNANIDAIQSFMQTSINQTLEDLDLLFYVFLSVSGLLILALLYTSLIALFQRQYVIESSEHLESNARFGFDLLNMNSDSSDFEVTVQQRRQMIYYVIRNASYGEHLRNKIKSPFRLLWRNFKKVFSK